jgi:hypothetical protein
MKRLFVNVVLAASLATMVAAAAASAVAEDSGKPIWQRHLSRTQATGAVFDLNIDGTHFRVPDAYFSMWKLPTPHGYPASNKIYSGFSFLFWVSDAKPTKLAMDLEPGYWSGEDGRPADGEKDFIVHAALGKVGIPQDATWESVKGRMPGSAMYALPRLADSNIYRKAPEPVHGLEQYTLISPAFREIVAVTPKGGDIDVVLITSWPRGPAPNPTWFGYILSRADGLFIRARFPEGAMHRWHDVARQSLTLLRAWRQ